MKNRNGSISPENTREERLADLAELVLKQIRSGDTPDLEAMCGTDADLAKELRGMLPTLRTMVDLGQQPFPGRDGEFHEIPVPEKIGEFRILRELGRGGMGIVYLAQQKNPDRHVALKVLSPNRLQDADNQERFQREIKATAQIEHANVLPILEVGVESATDLGQAKFHFYTMPYVEGASLDRVIRQLKLPAERMISAKSRRSRWFGWPWISEATAETINQHAQATKLSVENSSVNRIETQLPFDSADSRPDKENLESTSSPQLNTVSVNQLDIDEPARWHRIAEMGRDAASVLVAAHDQEILHRDIKPSNLLLDRNDKLWVTDFGLVKFLGAEQSMTDGIVGTVRFMAPERFDGWADPRSDVFSLGMTLYELATLQPAYNDSERSTLIYKIVNGKFSPPREVVDDIPIDLETIILTATAREPASRYATAEALRDDLTRFCRKQPILARRSSTRERVIKWGRRNPALALVSAFLVSLLLAISIGSIIVATRLNSLAGDLKQEKTSATQNLFAAYQNDAHARTTSQRPGQRVKALEAIVNAVELLPAVAHDDDDIIRLRSEAIAALILNDVELDREFRTPLVHAKSSPAHSYFAGADKAHVFRLYDASSGEQKWSHAVEMKRLSEYVVPIFSPKERFVVAFSTHAKKQMLFDANSGEKLLDFESKALSAFAPVAFSPDERLMAVCDNSRPIRIYELGDLSKPPIEVKPDFSIRNLFFMPSEEPEGHRLCGYDWDRSNGKLFSCDLETMIREVMPTFRHTTCLCPIRDGYIAASSDGHTRLVEMPQKRERAWIRGPGFCDYLNANHQAGLFFRHFWGNAFELRDLDSCDLIFTGWGKWPTFNSEGTFYSLSLDDKIQFYRVNPRNKFFRSGSTTKRLADGTVYLNQTGNLMVGAANGELLIFSSDTIRVVASTEDRVRVAVPMGERKVVYTTSGVLKLCHLADENGTFTIRSESPLTKVSTADGKVATSQSDQIAWRSPIRTIKSGRIENLESAIEIQPRPTPHPPYFRLSPNGELLALADGTIRLFSTTTGALIHDFGERTACLSRSYICFRGDGAFLVCNTGDEQLVLDVKNQNVTRSFFCRTNFGAAAWSRDSSLFARAADIESIVLYDGTTYQELATLRMPHKGGIRSVEFSPNDRYLFVCFNVLDDRKHSQVQRWDLSAIRNELVRLKLDW